MCYLWVYDFEKKFGKFFKQSDIKELKIIIGKGPYKQGLNGKDFKVNSSKYPYCKIGNNVAFFVNDWIKIQDSLEMIFNLIFNVRSNRANSIKILSYLREKKIPSDEFADYIYKKYSLLLTNITCKYENDNINNITGLINSIKKPTYLLLVGSDARDKVNKINSEYIKDYIDFIHPSGNNLSNSKDIDKLKKYYKNWYRLRDNTGKKQNIIDKFILFK